MKNFSKILIITLLISVSSIFAFNTTLNETNNTILIEEELLTNVSDSIVEDINPYKNKESKEIKFRYSETKLNDKIKTNVKDKLNSLKKEDQDYFIIEFNRNPSKFEINLLKDEGIKLSDYISDNTWYVSISNNYNNLFEEDSDGDLKLLNFDFPDKYLIRNIAEIKSDYKMKSKLKNKEFSFRTKDESGNVYLIVKFQKNIDLDEAKDLMTQNNIEVLNEIRTINSLTIKVAENNFEKLSNLNQVILIEEIPFKFGNQLSTSREVINVNTLQTTPYSLTGSGVTIFQYEGRIPYEHSDLEGRINNQEFISSEDNHATHVAGILIGDGTLNYSNRGIAINANLVVYETDYSGALPQVYNNTNQINSEYLDAIRDEGADLASNSWGQNIKKFLPGFNTTSLQLAIDNCDLYGDYELVGELFDTIVYQGATDTIWPYNNSNPIPIIQSVGNERNGDDNFFNPCENATDNYNPSFPYKTIDPIKGSKNTIAVGATYSHNNKIYGQSSYGPTDDDRIKPELVSPGCGNYEGILSTVDTNNYSKLIDGSAACGTSMAAPHVSGTIALMLEQWNKSGYQSSIGDPLPSTIKALLLDSTVDLSRTGNGTQMIDGPDYVNGFGLLDAKGAVDRIINGTFIESNISEEYDLDVYAINITYQDTLKVTLAWDDIPNHNLVNDLDLYLLSPSGTKYYPWTLDPSNPSDPAIQTEADHDNVVEQVYISEDEIEEGQWLIVVSSTECATTNCPQKYSLVSEYSISQYVPLSEDTDLYAYYTFNADTKDSTAYYNDATNYDATLTSSGCHDGSCYLFDGVNDYIDLNTNFDNTASEITFSGWFNLAETPSINAPYFDCVYDGNHEFSRLEYIPNQNGLRANWRTSDGNSQLASSYLTQDVNTWHHLVFVKNITSNKFTLYLDGIPKYSVTDEGNGDFNYLDRNCLLGKYHGSTGYWFEGKIDEISLWNRALSDLEIERLYSSGILIANYSSNSSNTTNPIIADSNLHAHYTFDTNTSDSSENNNDATNYGATLTSSDCHDGSCYSFDGSNDYIDLGTNFANTASEITFSGWYYPTNSPLVNAPYFDCVYDGSHEFSRLEYIPSQSGLRANWRTSDGNSQLASSYLTLSQNTWHHIAFVKNITSNKFNIYLDGEIEYSVTDNGNGDFNYNNRNCLLGKYHGSTGYWFEGKIDDLSLWDRAFSTEEIQRLYNYGISYE